MDIQRIRFLREIEVTDTQGQKASTLEFSCDDGAGRAPHFFRIPEDDLAAARTLYAAWGGTRPQGYRIGSTVRSPLWPAFPSRVRLSETSSH